MPSFNINLTSLAVILWSGMLIISGSIWVLCSQVRKLADILEERARNPVPANGPLYEARPVARVTRVARRGAPVRFRGAGTRGQAQLLAPRRLEIVPARQSAPESPSSRSEA
jgi:hypothetical protein